MPLSAHKSYHSCKHVRISLNGDVLSRDGPFFHEEAGCSLKLCLAPGTDVTKATLVWKKRTTGMFGNGAVFSQPDFCYYCFQTKNNLESNWRIKGIFQRGIKEIVKPPACRCTFLDSLWRFSSAEPRVHSLLEHGAGGQRGRRGKNLFFKRANCACLENKMLKIGDSHLA